MGDVGRGWRREMASACGQTRPDAQAAAISHPWSPTTTRLIRGLCRWWYAGLPGAGLVCTRPSICRPHKQAVTVGGGSPQVSLNGTPPAAHLLAGDLHQSLCSPCHSPCGSKRESQHSSGSWEQPWQSLSAVGNAEGCRDVRSNATKASKHPDGTKQIQAAWRAACCVAAWPGCLNRPAPPFIPPFTQ